MQTSTIFLIIGAAILALGIAVFQYFYKSKYKTSRNRIYALLRFLTVFGLLLLLINPKYKQVTYFTEKPALAIAVDNSASIEHLGYDKRVREAVVRFRESEQLQEAFDITFFKFGTTTEPLDSLSFSEKQTNIAQALNSLKTLYKNEVAPVVLLSDGNQTFGKNYAYTLLNTKQSIYTLVAGDTIVYDDLKLGQINVNRYAYINNQFPVEIFATYNGTNDISTQLTISSSGKTLHRETLNFSPNVVSKVINVLLPAEVVGVRQFSIALSSIDSEKNTTNNYKNFAIEVIDQKTNVAIISDLVHPDIGVLKKSIESNRLRSVTLLKPSEGFGKLNDYQLILMYQPNRNFSNVFDEINRLGKNSFIVTGKETDWRFLNGVQSIIRKEITGQKEDVLADLNLNFSSFLIDDLGFENFPPLENSFGEVTRNGEVDIALNQRIGRVRTDDPLLLAADQGGKRSVYLLGSGLWRWRAQSFLDKRSFEDFDNFVDKLVQYAASDKKKSRLDVDFNSFYYGNGDVKIYCQYFDKNYVFDARATLNMRVVNKETKEVYAAPFLLQRNGYEIDLSNLDAGEYSFTVTAQDQGISRSGSFTIIPFEVEQQFLNANIASLRKLSSDSKGTLYAIDDTEMLINDLVTDDRYRPIQKSNENVVPLIDWRWLLAALVALLALEWFMRKYNGLT
ncbi:VWA domain-containing protein [Dokdonia sinensis]|uniref:VWA domain-containing protein n=1 Tax=Dokdonia sinensis TaxID=2479847 RepID=A0A3M0FZK9_9FLAO|nr:VWA domain-containing protein [Dokdonia sinensis]RMB57347.1 VWA domain-containing protein [Dokdonia sinensis]